MVSPLRNTKERSQSPQRTVGGLFNIPVSEVAGKGGRHLGGVLVTPQFEKEGSKRDIIWITVAR